MPSMENIRKAVDRVFREADSNPDQEVSYHELITWVAHCSEIIELFQTYEPATKMEEPKKVFLSLNPNP